MTKDEALDLALEALQGGTGDTRSWHKQIEAAITAIKQARSAPVQEPVSMRMPKVGDKVVCIEDESLGTVVYLTAGGSPEIKFDDGSHGTYMLREFAELFGYTTPPAAQRQWVGLTDDSVVSEAARVLSDRVAASCNVDCGDMWMLHGNDSIEDARAMLEAAEAKLKEKNT